MIIKINNKNDNKKSQLNIFYLIVTTIFIIISIIIDIIFKILKYYKYICKILEYERIISFNYFLFDIMCI